MPGRMEQRPSSSGRFAWGGAGAVTCHLPFAISTASPLQSPFLTGALLVGQCRADELPEQGVGALGTRPELGVELAPHEPGMVGELEHLHQGAVRRKSAEQEAIALQALPVFVVHLVA